MYKIGLSSCGFDFTDENFQKLKSSGIEYIEVTTQNDQYDSLDYKQIKALSEKHGVKLWSFHLPFAPFDAIDISSPDSQVRNKTIEYFSLLIKKAADIGIDKFIVHPSGEPVRDELRADKLSYSAQSLNTLAQIADKCGAVIAVENIPRSCLCNCSSEMLQLLSANDKLRVCFDTNHLLKESFVDFIDKVGEKIITLHVSDYDFINERHWLPGEGRIDWTLLTNTLKKVNYGGIWLYEISLKCPKTIYRDRDLVFDDFVQNANAVLNGKTPPLFHRHKEKLGMWE